MKSAFTTAMRPQLRLTARVLLFLLVTLSLTRCSQGQVNKSTDRLKVWQAVPAADSANTATIPTVSDSAIAAAIPTVSDSAMQNSICRTHANALKGITILVDAGHGGAQLGAHFGSVQEKNITLAVAYKLRARLQAMGANVHMTRLTDTDITLEDRVNQSIALRPDIFISVHANANRHTSIDGIETYYFDSRSKDLATTLLGSVSQGLQEKPNWAQQEGLFVCHHNVVPSTLVEIGYLSNSRTEALLITDSYQERTAESIAAGVLNYFQKRSPARGCILSNGGIMQVVQAMKKGMLARSNAIRHRLQWQRKGAKTPAIARAGHRLRA